MSLGKYVRVFLGCMLNIIAFYDFIVQFISDIELPIWKKLSLAFRGEPCFLVLDGDNLIACG